MKSKTGNKTKKPKPTAQLKDIKPKKEPKGGTPSRTRDINDIYVFQSPDR